METTIKTLLQSISRNQTQLAAACRTSTATISLIVTHGQWPKRNEDAMRAAIRAFLLKHGVDAKRVDQAVPSQQTDSEAAPSENHSDQEDSMLLKNVTLTPAARKQFGLYRNPFVNDVVTIDDVFMSPDIRFCREAMWDAAKNGGFCAIVGESGSGKTTLREEMTERIKRENADVIVIEPYVLAMEENDIKGKTLKSSQIAETIVNVLDPSTTLKRTPHARFKQAHDLLKASYKAGNSHVLIIEEAHCLPTATLKHLKRFLELKDGFTRLLSVILIGQPELKAKLSDRNPEVREVVQRCEVVELGPLDRHIEAYVKHKLARANVDAKDVFDADAYDAIRAKLTRTPRDTKPANAVSICYPLVVNNLIALAMNNAVNISASKINAELIQEAA